MKNKERVATQCTVCETRMFSKTFTPYKCKLCGATVYPCDICRELGYSCSFTRGESKCIAEGE